MYPLTQGYGYASTLGWKSPPPEAGDSYRASWPLLDVDTFGVFDFNANQNAGLFNSLKVELQGFTSTRLDSCFFQPGISFRIPYPDLVCSF